MDLYNHTDGPGWRDSDGWGDDSQPCCEWFGVTCDTAHSALNKLRLANNDLRGTLPESLGRLDELEELIMCVQK
jgi:hypothetical protein